MKQTFTLSHPIARQRAHDAVDNAPDGWVVQVGEPTRNLDQNSAQWPLLEQLSKSRQWPVNGIMTWLSAEDWKNILTSAFEGETSPRLAAGYGGGVVMLGRRTSQYGKKRFSEWLDWLNAAVVELVEPSNGLAQERP